MFELPAGSKKFTVRVDSGKVRMYGVEFSKGRPGVMYGSLGINGANITLLGHVGECGALVGAVASLSA